MTTNYSLTCGRYCGYNFEMKKNPSDLNIKVEPEEDVQSPNKVSSFAASRLLKQAEVDVETVRRRIQMLRMLEDKNQRKIEEERRKVRQLEEIKEKTR